VEGVNCCNKWIIGTMTPLSMSCPLHCSSSLARFPMHHTHCSWTVTAALDSKEMSAGAAGMTARVHAVESLAILVRHHTASSKDAAVRSFHPTSPIKHGMTPAPTTRSMGASRLDRRRRSERNKPARLLKGMDGLGMATGGTALPGTEALTL